MAAAPGSSKKRRHRLFIILSILLILVTTTLSLLPLGIDYGLTQWIKQHGGEQVSVANVDFNPFSATLRLDDLKVTNQGKNKLTLPRLDLQLAWRPLFNKQVVITGMDLSGVVLKLIQNGTDSQLQIGGMQFSAPVKKEPTEATPWAVRLNRIGLSNVVIDYQGAKLSTQVQIEKLGLTDIASDNKAGIAQVELQGSIDQAPVKLNGGFTPFADHPSFKGDIQIQSLVLDTYAKLAEPQLELLKGKLSMNGDISLLTRQSGTPRITHNGALNLASYQVNYQGQVITGDQLSWKGRLSHDTDTLLLNGSLTSAEVRFNSKDGDNDYHHRALEWQGDLKLHSTASTQNISSNSRLNIQAPEIGLADSRSAMEQIGLSLENATLTLSGEDLSTRLPGGLKLAGISLTTPTRELINESLNWEGTVQLNRQEALTTLALEGSLEDGPLQLKSSEDQATIALQNITWQGGLELEQDQHGNRIKPSGDLTATGFEAIDSHAKLQLLSIESLRIDRLAGDDKNAVTAALIDARSISAGAGLADTGRDNPAMLTLEGMQIQQPGYSISNGLRINKIETTGLKQALIRQPDKSLNLQQLADAIRRLIENNSETARESSDQPLPVMIDQLTLDGDSLLGFEDRTTDPVYHLRLKPELFRMNGITNTPADTPATFQLKGILDKSSILELNGDLALFAAEPTFTLKGRIEGLELPPLSAYTIPLMGYRLQSGKANSDIQFTAKAGQIDGSSDLVLNQLQVEPLNSEKMAALQQQLSIPLETALGMLKDKNSQIKLNLPVSGAIDNIQVDPSDAINQAIGRAMKKGARTYLATALFPFGTLLTLVELAGDAAAKIQLDPIPFDPGSSQLNPDQHEYLTKIAQLLNDRPEIYIRLCGVSATTDIEALRQAERQRLEAATEKEKNRSESSRKQPPPAPPPTIEISDQQLNQLAVDRATSIERYLSNTHQTKTERLVSCQPRIEKTAEKAAPRVDLLI